MLHCNHDYDVEHYEFKTGEAAENRANSFCASGSSDYSLGQIPGSDHSIATFFAEISGKIYALSLMITLAGRGYVRQKLSEVNIGRMSSGGTGPSRSAQIDPITTRARSVRYQHDRAMSGGVVAVQLDDFTSRTNPVVAGEAVGDHNDSDGEAAPSQYSKTDDTKFRI
ncbi:hypothetical protein CTheo_5597 [Ceratobasidium theobromae]|uniref:Uncharacterized protein n=1 Tax=Ceratobasidium theobromae TaxID=1582974 RepID=A0A5N5QHL7_9AGAM|nr:hypothetical protein CTheo_5597 [Ceratobasidium theobromae]